MHRPFLSAAALVLAAAPSFAAGAVVVNIVPVSQTFYNLQSEWKFEVYGADLTGDDERLSEYTLVVQGTGTGANGTPFGNASGARFAVPTGSTFGLAGRPTVHPYVFKDFQPIPPIEMLPSSPSRVVMLAEAIGPDEEADIDGSHDGLFRVTVVISNDSVPTTYTLAVTSVSLTGRGPPIVATAGPPLTFAVVPEPSAAVVLVVPALALLRRRTAASC
jgi:hypothetical protein